MQFKRNFDWVKFWVCVVSYVKTGFCKFSLR